MIVKEDLSLPFVLLDLWRRWHKTIPISRGNKVCCIQDGIVASESDSELVVYVKENDFIVNELCCDSESDDNFYSDSNIVPAT